MRHSSHSLTAATILWKHIVWQRRRPLINAYQEKAKIGDILVGVDQTCLLRDLNAILIFNEEIKVYFPNDLETMGFHHIPLDLKTSCPFEDHYV